MGLPLYMQNTSGKYYALACYISLIHNQNNINYDYGIVFQLNCGKKNSAHQCPRQNQFEDLGLDWICHSTVDEIEIGTQSRGCAA